VPTTINRQPTLAAYHSPPRMTSYQLFALDIFRIEDRRIAEITAFETTNHKLYGLPATL
jgi:RNA polymerase sigma-70 factor (ECF subfamily)